MRAPQTAPLLLLAAVVACAAPVLSQADFRYNELQRLPTGADGPLGAYPSASAYMPYGGSPPVAFPFHVPDLPEDMPMTPQLLELREAYSSEPDVLARRRLFDRNYFLQQQASQQQQQQQGQQNAQRDVPTSTTPNTQPTIAGPGFDYDRATQQASKDSSNDEGVEPVLVERLSEVEPESDDAGDKAEDSPNADLPEDADTYPATKLEPVHSKASHASKTHAAHATHRASSSSKHGSKGSASKQRFKESNVTPILSAPTSALPAQPEDSNLHKCIPIGPNACSVRFDRNAVSWVTEMVPAGSLRATGAQTTVSGTASDAEGGAAVPTDRQLSANPQIRAAQEAFYQRHELLLKEQQWMAQVRKIIQQYQLKLSNVHQHALAETRALEGERRRIIGMIKEDKKRKLEAELQAALSTLRRLDSTTGELNTKIGSLVSTKLGLKNTISRLQSALGRAAVGDEGMPRVSTAALQRFREQMGANVEAKQLLGSLLQFVEKAQPHHERVIQVHKANLPALSGQADLLQDEDVPPEFRENYRSVADEAERSMPKVGALPDIGTPEWDSEFAQTISDAERDAADR